MNEETKKDIVIKSGKILYDAGLIARTWGNMSIRDGRSSFLITASGRDYLTLNHKEVVKVNMNSLDHVGGIAPSTEKGIHAGVYKIKEDVNFIIHTHQEMASAMSVLGVKSIKVSKEYDLLGGEVLVADYGLPGTMKLCENTVEAVNKAKGHSIIMKNHGALCFGENFEQAYEAALQLEEAMKVELENRGVKAEYTLKPELKDFYIEDGVYYCKNKEPLVMKYATLSNVLRPYIDDFAQIVGMKIGVSKEGILCKGDDLEDLIACYMIVNKNVLAYFAARTSRLSRPLSTIDAGFMRQNYLNHYSKQKIKE